MVDLHRIGMALGRLLVRSIETALAVLLFVTVWLLGELPSGPDVPEQAGTFVWGFLFGWAFVTFSLVVIVGGHLLVKGYRLWSQDGIQSFRAPVSRLLAETIIGVALVVVAPPVDPSGGPIVVLLTPPTVLAWTVLVHHTVDTVRFGQSLVGSG